MENPNTDNAANISFSAGAGMGALFFYKGGLILVCRSGCVSYTDDKEFVPVFLISNILFIKVEVT
jgi:hypothetical protein